MINGVLIKCRLTTSERWTRITRKSPSMDKRRRRSNLTSKCHSKYKETS
jgi:hypothetical protein